MHTVPKHIYVFCDGSTGALDAAGTVSRRKPAGHCAAAAVARDGAGKILAIEWQVLPPVTNNEAEYAGLLLGIELARRLRAEASIFILDSETVVCQMTGRCAVNSPRLRTWHTRACAAVRGLPGVHYRVIPRAYNRLADGAAGQAAIAWHDILHVISAEQGAG
jgi:probable phosphoglycerate mutase